MIQEVAMATAWPSCHLLQSVLGPGHPLGFLEIGSLWWEVGRGEGVLLTLPLLPSPVFPLLRAARLRQCGT